MWQALYEELKEQDFVVIAVAMDSRDDAARPWIEQADASYPCLIDREHRVADLYNMVNVPQAVWIDEQGHMVRPSENAGAYESFRSLDRSTGKIPEAVAEIGAKSRQTYLAAIRDWVAKGEVSEHVFDTSAARAHVSVMQDDIALAHANFRLGLYLLRQGKTEEGDAFMREASRLHPDSWNMWRQHCPLDERGLASNPEFWRRVEALGERKYYPAVDMAGMPQ